MSNLEHRTTLTGDTSTSVEDYLEAILVLGQRSGASVRVTDVSAYLGVSKPSVSAAAKKLATAGLVEHECYGAIRLTQEGRQGALRVAARHELLLRFLVEVLGVEQATAEEDACRLEHFLSEETVGRLHQFVAFLTDGAVRHCLRRGVKAASE